MNAIRFLLFMGIFIFLFSGCILDTRSLSTIQGNISFSRGDWQEATVHYLKAQKSSGDFSPWIAYDLANVYHALGELDSALKLWNAAAETKDLDLRFDVLFNRGLALYEAGRFGDSYQDFREALTLDPANVDAKRNLELAQKKTQQGATTRQAAALVPAPREISEESSRLLEYMRRKESQAWVPGGGSSASNSPNDW